MTASTLSAPESACPQIKRSVATDTLSTRRHVAMVSGYTDQANSTLYEADRAYSNADQRSTEEAIALLAKATAQQAVALHRIADHLTGV